MAVDIRQPTLDEEELFASGWLIRPARWERVRTLEERWLAEEAAAFLRAIIPVFKPADRQDAIIVRLPTA